MDLPQQNLWGVSNQELIILTTPQVKSKMEKYLPQGERHGEEPSFKLSTMPGINQPTTSVESTCWILIATQVLASYCGPYCTSLPLSYSRLALYYFCSPVTANALRLSSSPG